MIFRAHAGELHYEDFGQGPAVVVLHDYPSNQELRADLFEALAETGCRVIIINPAGLARTSSPAPAAEEQTQKVLALFNYLGIGRAVVIGIARGGYATLDLLERFPARVAAASFVVSAQLAADLRRQAGSRESLQALRKGRCSGLKEAFKQVRQPTSGATLPQLPRLRALILRLRERCNPSLQRRRLDRSAFLTGLGLPSLVIEEEASVGPSSPAPPPRQRSLRPLRSLSAPLQALLTALLPDESLFEDEVETPEAQRVFHD